MLKQHLTLCKATVAAAALTLTVPALGQYEQDRGQPGQDRDQERQPDMRRPGQQQQPGHQQAGQPAADLPDEVRQVLTSLDGMWTVDGTFFGEEGAEVTQVKGQSQRKWVLNNHILQADLKLQPEGQAAQPGQRRGQQPGQPGDMNQPGAQGPGLAVGAVDGLWFLGYDAATDEYKGVWMDSKSAAIRCDDGRWESSERKLIFEGEYTKPETDDTVSTRLEIQVQTDNRHVVTMFEDPGLLDPERRVYTLTFVRAGEGMQPGHQDRMRPGQDRPGAQGQPTMFNGTIADFSEVQMPGADAQGKTFARIRLENGKQAVLAFDQDVQIDQLGVSSGDEVQIRGTETQVGGQSVIKVQSIRANGREVPLTARPDQQRPGQPGRPGQGADANLRGEVAQITEAQVQGADAANRTFAHIRFQDGKDAILAFDRKVDIEGLNISQGDQVTVLGTQTEMNGRTIINVRGILLNGRPVDLEAGGN